MKRTYYSATDLRGSLDKFEARFGLRSADFYDAYAARDEARMEGVPNCHRFSWATFYGEWCRLSDRARTGLGGRL